MYDSVCCLLLSHGYVCFVFTDSIIWHNVVRLGRPVLLDASYFSIQSRYVGCAARTKLSDICHWVENTRTKMLSAVLILTFRGRVLNSHTTLLLTWICLIEKKLPTTHWPLYNHSSIAFTVFLAHGNSIVSPFFLLFFTNLTSFGNYFSSFWTVICFK